MPSETTLVVMPFAARAADLRAAAGDLLGVGAVGEEQHVLEVDRLLLERGVAGVERDVDVDAAAADADGADLRRRSRCRR